MKYAKEIIDLLSAYPNKKFKMKTLVSIINPNVKGRDYEKIRKGVNRVIKELQLTGHLKIHKELHQSNTRYSWKDT